MIRECRRRSGWPDRRPRARTARRPSRRRAVDSRGPLPEPGAFESGARIPDHGGPAVYARPGIRAPAAGPLATSRAWSVGHAIRVHPEARPLDPGDARADEGRRGCGLRLWLALRLARPVA